MEKMEEFVKLYEELGDTKIDNLYFYSCLKCSGFKDENAYKLIDVLKELWVKDETNTSISSLSDMLYENYEDLDIENMTAREILEDIML